MEEAQVQEQAPATEQAPAQEAVTEAPAQEAPVQEAPAEASPAFQIFDTPEDLSASMQREVAQEAVVQQEVTPQPEAPNPIQDRVVQPEPEQAQYTQADVEGAVLGFLSERLGRQVSSLDDIAQPRKLDERIETIARFVEETGRNPEDWFAYQRLNTSEMDDLTAIRVQMSADNPTLSSDEVNLLIQSKYSTSSEASAEDKQLVQLRMKMDGQKAKQAIEDLRQGYVAPEVQKAVEESQPLVDQAWVHEMEQNVDALTGLEFDLGGEKTFTFGMDDAYRQELKYKNANLENYFDPYVREDGSWDFDLLSSHRTVIDNIDKIVQAAYRQGMSEGQRGVVQNAANVQAKAPDDASGQPNSNPLQDQLKILAGKTNNRMTFNI